MPRKVPARGGVSGLEGTRVGRYLLRDCLGRGNHTAVYRASTPSGEWCALKLVDARLQGDDDLAERLRQVAAVLDQIRHPHIVPILNPASSGEVTLAAMPLMVGPTLLDLMRGGSLDSERAWTILNHVADSLQSAHEWGLTYKVLKPANILVRDDRAFLAEFGIAGRCAGPVGLADPDCNLLGAQYLAPEQVLGVEPDHRADIYAFGVLVFELATSTPLHAAPPAAILQRTLNAPAPSAHARNPLIPREVDGVLCRAMEKDPRRRHASIGELIDELVSPPQRNGDHARGEVAAGEGSGSGVVTIDSLIDVLSGVMSPRPAHGGAPGG